MIGNKIEQEIYMKLSELLMCCFGVQKEQHALMTWGKVSIFCIKVICRGRARQPTGIVRTLTY